MIFSSFTFLFVFLPLVLNLYFIVKNRKYRNTILLLFSLLFYAWGEPIYIYIMIFSIATNYAITLKMDELKSSQKKWLLGIDIFLNIAIIGFFKYGNFIIQNINSIFKCNISQMNIALPIGISFYTFQVLSYVIDVYRKKVKVEKSIINLGMYITLFPQLIAGPIVRYETIANEIHNRKESFMNMYKGIKRFIIGLGKKVLIANPMAVICDTIYTGDIQTKGTVILWIAAISYTLQIYFDFSGYSDMAIGLGKIFGFKFPENFNFPYLANSITDFWRRWHISLSTWFKDYVYIPLGGNRVKKIKWLRNIIIVWILTGLWHGASWNYVLWGLYYGILLIIEKQFLSGFIKKIPKVCQHLYTMVFIIIGWVIFRIENIPQIIEVITRMFKYYSSDIIDSIILNYDIFSSLPYIIIAIIGCFPISRMLKNKFKRSTWLEFIENSYIFMVFILSILALQSTTYNPFIYFKF